MPVRTWWRATYLLAEQVLAGDSHAGGRAWLREQLPQRLARKLTDAELDVALERARQAREAVRPVDRRGGGADPWAGALMALHAAGAVTRRAKVTANAR